MSCLGISVGMARQRYFAPPDKAKLANRSHTAAHMASPSSSNIDVVEQRYDTCMMSYAAG